MSRKGENIYKRKDGRWEGRYIKKRTLEGKAVYGSVYGKTYHAVKEKLRAAAAACGDVGRSPDVQAHSDDNPPCSCEFGTFAEEWLDFIRPQIKESSYTKYRNLVRTYMIPGFKGEELSSMTADSIRNFRDELLTKGGTRKKGLSAKTASDALTVLRSIIRYAEAQGIHMSCTGKEVTIRRAPIELVILQKAEQERLYRYLAANPSRKALGILIAMFTGLRVGEVCALKWSDISLEKKTLHVHQTLQRVQIEGDPEKKTRIFITTPKSACSIRTIPLPDNLMEIIRKDYPARQGYILSGSDSRCVEPRILQRYFRKSLTVNQIAPVNFHALRHTFATRCIEVGFDVKSLSEILGHSSVTITMNRYVHPTMELKAENMQRLSALFTVS